MKSAPYHPAANGLAERFVQSFKQSLKASPDDSRSLSQRLAVIVPAFVLHRSTCVPPCKLFLQRDLWTRFTLLQPDIEKNVQDKQASQKSAHDRRARAREWTVGEQILVLNLRPGPDWIPGIIAEVH